jgi:hypothetical protein
MTGHLFSLKVEDSRKKMSVLQNVLNTYYLQWWNVDTTGKAVKLPDVGSAAWSPVNVGECLEENKMPSSVTYLISWIQLWIH